jgi:Phycobilisome protein
MNNRISEILVGSDSRYLTEEERKEVLDYVKGFDERFRVMALIEANEDAAVRFCIENTRKRYPNFDKYHGSAWAKAFRDVQLTTRYMAQAMMLDEMSILEDKLLFWLRTILAGLNFTPEFNRDTYTYLKQGFRQSLPPDAFTVFEPFMNRTIEIMSDFPAPATPAV